jgi:hypothetical protein
MFFAHTLIVNVQNLNFKSVFVCLNVKTDKINGKSKVDKNGVEVNPFIKLIEDKLKISEAAQKGDSLSSLKDIHFVKPI